jgi:hypothetical protein
MTAEAGVQATARVLTGVKSIEMKIMIAAWKKVRKFTRALLIESLRKFNTGSIELYSPAFPVIPHLYAKSIDFYYDAVKFKAFKLTGLSLFALLIKDFVFFSVKPILRMGKYFVFLMRFGGLTF